LYLRGVLGIRLISALALALLAPLPAHGQPGPGPKPPPAAFNEPVTFCTLAEENGDCVFSRPMGLVVADLIDDPNNPNDDGYPEIAVVNTATSRSVTVFDNTGDWSAPESALVRRGPFGIDPLYPYDIKVGDLGPGPNDPVPDGLLDLVVTLDAHSKVAILYNLGNGEFRSPQVIALGQSRWPHGLVVSDLDLNGTQDIAVATSEYVVNDRYARVTLLWREVGGAWTQEVIGEEHLMPLGMTTEIVARSVAKKSASPAYLDLVMATMGDYHVTLVNQGGRQFANAIWSDHAPGTSIRPRGIALGQFRAGAAYPDAVASDCFTDDWPHYCGDSADVFWNDGFGLFAFDDDYEVRSGEQEGADTWGVAVGKLNPDTANDIVVAIGHEAPCSPGGGIAVFVGYGDGTFVEPPSLICVDPYGEPKPKFVKIADLDQDGFNDVVTSNYWNGHNISVLINAFQAVPPGG
jgi:hypothetical protein